MALTMAEESGKILGQQITVTRAEVLNRFWDLARMSPEQTNGTIYGQIKAAETLAHVFDIKIFRQADLDHELRGRTTDEIDYFVANGYFPEAAEDYPGKTPRRFQPIASLQRQTVGGTGCVEINSATLLWIGVLKCFTKPAQALRVPRHRL